MYALKGIFLMVVCCLPFAAGHTAPSLSVVESTSFTVENDYYRLVIDAEKGGSIRSFIYKPFDPSAEWIYDVGGGLLQDMIWQQKHPGELQDHPYEYRVIEQSEDRFSIELWRTFRRPPYAGLVMRKEIRLRADSAAIRVRMTLENSTDDDMFPGAWVQNRFFGGGRKGVPVSFRPSYLGMRMSYFEDGRTVGDEFVRRPSAGWSATFDRETGAGFIGLVDYNYLQQHYSCLPAYTMEFFFDRVLIRPGASWSTEYLLVPAVGMKNCYYADERVYITADREEDRVSFVVHAIDRPVGKTEVSITAMTSDRSQILAEQSATFDAVSGDTSTAVPVTIPGIVEQPVIVEIAVTSEGKKGQIEFIYSADPGFYHLQETAVPYRAKLPKKHKPELMAMRDLVLRDEPGLQVFYAFGLWHELNRVREALRSVDPQVRIDESVFRTGTLGPELSRQPLLAEELLGYDLVVLNNVGADALGEAGEIAVQQYVAAGGRLLVCGGLYSLGKSRWDESPLAEVLPLITKPFWDLKALPEFQSMGDGLGAVRWVQTPASVCPEATVLLRIGDVPLLVTGEYGKGKTAVWLGTPMGEPPSGVIPYWRSPEWTRFLTTIISNMIDGEKVK